MPRQTALPSYEQLSASISTETLFYQVPREMALKAINARLSSSEWALWTYLQLLDPHGDRLIQLPSVAELAKAVGISDRQAHRALNRIKDLGLYYWEPVVIRGQNLAGKLAKEIRRHKGNAKFSDEDKLTTLSLEGQSCQDEDKVVNFESKLSFQRQSCLREEPEPLPQADFGMPHTIQTYSDFIQTLSEGERENFKNYCQNRADKEAKNPRAWIAKCFRDLYGQWKEQEAKRKEADELIALSKAEGVSEELPTAAELNDSWRRLKAFKSKVGILGIEEQAKQLGYAVTEKGIFESHSKASSSGNSSGRGFLPKKE